MTNTNTAETMMRTTENTISAASRALAKAICEIRKVDGELAGILASQLSKGIQEYRTAKHSDAIAVADEARALEEAA